MIETRLLLENGIPDKTLSRLAKWITAKPWETDAGDVTLSEVRITRGAYSKATATHICGYLAAMAREDVITRKLLRFALLCVLESVSYTRRDGQYLRWDHRSGRSLAGKPFDKGPILPFAKAITSKLQDMIADIGDVHVRDGLFTSSVPRGPVKLHRGSCLEILPMLDAPAI